MLVLAWLREVIFAIVKISSRVATPISQSREVPAVFNIDLSNSRDRIGWQRDGREIGWQAADHHNTVLCFCCHEMSYQD